MTDWMDLAACKGQVDVMYPADAVGVPAAREVCAGCVVSEQCLEHALEHRERHGIWGGKSERQRKTILELRSRMRRAS